MAEPGSSLCATNCFLGGGSHRARRRDCNDVASPQLSVKLRDCFSPAQRFSLRARVQLGDLPGNPPSNYWGACIGAKD
jgi:hypothetical protein